MGDRRSGLWLWANERLDGGLAARLTDWRLEGITLDGIVDRLRDLNLEVSRETVRRWLRDLEISEPVR